MFSFSVRSELRSLSRSVTSRLMPGNATFGSPVSSSRTVLPSPSVTGAGMASMARYGISEPRTSVMRASTSRSVAMESPRWMTPFMYS